MKAPQTVELSRRPHWESNEKSPCPCGSGNRFVNCCKPNGHLCNESFILLDRKDYKQAEIALRAKLTEYAGFIFRHTLLFIEKGGSIHPGLSKIDINAIEEIAHALSVALQAQGKLTSIVPLFDHIAQSIPLPGLYARMAYLKGTFVLLVMQNEEEARKTLMTFKGLIVSLDAKLLRLYLDLFRTKEVAQDDFSRIEGWIAFLNSYDKFSSPCPFDDYQHCLQKFQKPAGDDPRFNSFAGMKENRTAFFELTHRAYKEIHLLSLAHIVSLELALSCSKDSLNSNLERTFKYTIRLWRRLNDAIAWQMNRQQQHVMRALSFNRVRGPLIECNPNSVVPLLSQINADPLKLAVWTDSTSGVDVGDILIADLNTGKITCAEVKEGRVNDEIIQLLNEPNIDFGVSVSTFLARRGKYGAKQFKRVLSQLKRDHQFADLIRNEKGFDPSLGKEIEIMDLTSVPDESWDDELSKLLEGAKRSGENLVTVDTCLWVWASTTVRGGIETATNHFIETLKRNNGDKVIEWINAHRPGDEISAVVSLQESAFAPARIPLCCHNLTVEHMLEITHGTTCVLMAFDWSAFGKLLQKYSVELNWSSVKEARRERAKKQSERRFIIGEKIVSISKGEAVNFIGSKHLLRIYFDGVRPKSVAKQMNLSLDLLIQQSKESNSLLKNS